MKLFFSSMLVVFLGLGCAGTSSNNREASQTNSQNSSQVSQKRMMVIAQTYQQRGHHKRAIQIYKQVLNEHPKSQLAITARQRIIALNGSRDEKKEPKAAEQSMLVETEQPQQAISRTKPEKTQVEPVSLETKTASETSQLPLPFPEQPVSPAKPTSMKPLIDDKAPSNQKRKTKKTNRFEDASWPQWTKPRESSKNSQASDYRQPAKLSQAIPNLDSFHEHVQKEELLSPPAAPMKQNKEQEAESNNEQEQTTQRLASVIYLIGKEKNATEDILNSLEVLLDHENQHVRINSAEALFQHGRGSEKAMSTITKNFSSNDESMRIIAVHALVSAYDQSPEETVQYNGSTGN